MCASCTFINSPSGLSGGKVIGLAACEMCGEKRKSSSDAKAATADASAFTSVAAVNASSKAPAGKKREPAVKVSMSGNTGRMWLYTAADEPMGVNFHPDDYLSDDVQGLPPLLDTQEAKAHITRFIKVRNCALVKTWRSHTILL